MGAKLALVLGGGGARGAFQVGALRALLAAGYAPSVLVGTSIGAVNAAFLGLHGLGADSLDRLEAAWYDAAKADLLPTNYLWLTVRSLFGRGGGGLESRLQEFLGEYGLTPGLRFGQLPGPPIYLVTADLASGRPAVYGDDPEEDVVEGVLASAALPPWIHPLEKRDRLLATLFRRQLDLELALAAALEVQVRLISLRSKEPVAIWDFSRSRELIQTGYAIASAEIATWSAEKAGSRLPLRSRLAGLGVWSAKEPAADDRSSDLE